MGFIKTFAIVAAVSMTAISAQAATLTSSFVTVDPDTDPAFPSSLLAPQTVAVKKGSDGNIAGSQFFDVNAGAGNLFTITSTGRFGSFAGGNTVSWTISGLMFEGGNVLTGINFLTDFGDVALTSLTDSSFSFKYNDITIPRNTPYIQAEYLVSPSAVPLPAALPLLGAALLGFGAVARRRKNRAV